jgi:NAD(P)-dependent dehydrogenase (short-subunit alcohol dehydrogenase family)
VTEGAEEIEEDERVEGTMLEGRVALVTGATRGLGLAMCEGFAAHRARLVIASRKAEQCVRVAGELGERFGVDTLPVAANVSEWAACDRLVDAALDRFGRIDVLVNNAGLSPLYPSLPEVTEELWNKVLAVNLRGPFRLMAKVGEAMTEQGSGSIINISSSAAVRPRPGALPYAAAKAGLNTLTEGFAQALGPHVRVNAIQVGPFRTDVAESWDAAAFAERARTSIALQRAGEPAEIVGAALYLASDASSYCTGAVLRLDGGVY